MLAARLGAWLRNTGEKWARTSFAEKLALLLALLAVIYTVVTGAAELRYQARAREALAQVKAARLAAGAVSAQCYSTGRTFADQTTADGFADGVAEEIETLGALPGSVSLLQVADNGYTVLHPALRHRAQPDAGAVRHELGGAHRAGGLRHFAEHRAH